MRIDDYQRDAARTRNPALDPRARLMDAAAGLAEESGEVLAIVRKHVYQGRDLDRAQLAEELGDVLWCLAAVAADAGLTLGDVAGANLGKLRLRHPDGFLPPPA